MLNSDQGLALLRQTQALSRHKQGSQQGFVSIMCPFSTLTETIYLNPQQIETNKYMGNTSPKSFNN